MIEMKIDQTKEVDRKDFLALEFYKKLAFTGCRGNMSYKIKREQIETEEPEELPEGTKPKEEYRFHLYYWPGPYAFDKTEDTLKQEAFFDFSEEGLHQIADFLNEKYENNLELWTISTIR